jgi:hypothetical protein
MVAESSFETSVTAHCSTHSHDEKEVNRHQHRCENLTSCLLSLVKTGKYAELQRNNTVTNASTSKTLRKFRYFSQDT